MMLSDAQFHNKHNGVIFLIPFNLRPCLKDEGTLFYKLRKYFSEIKFVINNNNIKTVCQTKL